MTNSGERTTSLETDGGDTRIEPGIGEQLPLFSGGPGAWLRSKREEKKITLERVADELLIPPGKVKALELDDYDQLPEAVYIQGYLRNYARFLGEPVEPVLSAFQSVNPPPEEEPLLQASMPIKPEISSNHRVVRMASTLIGLLLLVLLFIWWGDYLQRAWWKDGEEIVLPPAEEALPELATMDSEPLLLPPMQEEAIFLADEPMESSQADGLMEEDPTVLDEDQPPVEAGPPKIVFQFSAACWTEVRDDRGRVQLIGEFRAGDRRILEGEAPFKVVLGNTPAVELTVDGQLVDLTQHSRGNVARFVLDPTEL
jgi:cytoskeleton protein RodZ